ncbi:MAG: D-alanine--D-alanine ligase [Desulfobacteraceae bacterium]|nr:D-alanine--D-alanine ligase [Desulfobacteraceae bacterium]
MKKTIALLAGGVSSEREVSLNSGEQVYQALDKNKYDIRRYDPKTDLSILMAEASQIDAALIILHGPYGEDGTVQGLLELLDIPYQGAGVLGSAIAINKLASKQFYEKWDIPIPDYKVLKRNEKLDPDKIISELGLPLVIKPVNGGSSIGMSIVRGKNDFTGAIDKAFGQDASILAEAYIAGMEITCAVLGNEDPEALPLIEIIPDKDHEFFDYNAKYTSGITEEICPARIDPMLTQRAQSLAKLAHQALFCKGYSRTDMIVRGQDVFVLETNTIPGMTTTSLYPQAAKAAGISFSQLLDRLIDLGIQTHYKR